MFALTFFLGPQIGPVVLLFKGEDAAKSAVNAFEVMGPQAGVWIEDDFGQRFFAQKPVVGVLLQDMKLAREADIERGVFQAVTQAKAQERAKADPTLQAHFRSQQGPAVLNPMGMTGMPRFS